MADFKRYSGVILKCKNKVLLCKRAKGQSLPNVWSVPVGGIDENESPNVAAKREFNEETNIKLTSKIDFIDIINQYKKDGTTKKGLFFVFKSDVDKEIIPDLDKAEDGHEHSECRYFTSNELPITKDNKDLMKIIKKILK